MTTLHLSSKGFRINSVSIVFPVALQTLKECLNDDYRIVKRKSNTIFT
ncbi:DUF7738 domain-containing protein [Winogradskyella sp. PC D3.3]